MGDTSSENSGFSDVPLPLNNNDKRRKQRTEDEGGQPIRYTAAYAARNMAVLNAAAKVRNSCEKRYVAGILS
jgi:hypothetical protein